MARMGTAGKVRAAMAAMLALALALAAARLALPYLDGAEKASSVRALKSPAAAAPAESRPADGGGSGEEGGESSPAAGPANIDWAGLLSENPAAVGWVELPGTRVDYPIVQASTDDPQRYLYYDIDGARSFYGCPYVDSGCLPTGGIDSPFVVVYGHHLINGEMFSDFAKMTGQGYAEAHPIAYVDTPRGRRTLRVLGARAIDADEEGIRVGFATRAEAAAYAASELEGADSRLSPPSGAGRIWCFVTCSYETNNSRTLVFAEEG